MATPILFPACDTSNCTAGELVLLMGPRYTNAIRQDVSLNWALVITTVGHRVEKRVRAPESRTRALKRDVTAAGLSKAILEDTSPFALRPNDPEAFAQEVKTLATFIQAGVPILYARVLSLCGIACLSPLMDINIICACPFSVRHRVPFSPHGYQYYMLEMPLT